MLALANENLFGKLISLLPILIINSLSKVTVNTKGREYECKGKVRYFSSSQLLFLLEFKTVIVSLILKCNAISLPTLKFTVPVFGVQLIYHVLDSLGGLNSAVV